MDTTTDGTRQLMWATQALAQPAHVQLSLFPEFARKPDELALDVAHWCEVVIESEGRTLTPTQRDALAALDVKLASMSGPKTPHWTDDALRGDPAWAEVRQLARAALAACAWPPDVPPPDRSTYVRGGGDAIG